MRTAILFLCVGAVAGSRVASGGENSALEIRFCPQALVRTFPLESQRGIQSLLLQNAALINRGASPVELTAVDLELLQDGRVVDTRQLAGADLTRAGASGAALQQSGMLKMLAFQFCGASLIGDGITLAGPALAPQQAMLLAQQPFAYRGKRGTLRLRANGRRDRHEFEVSATLPVSASFAKTALRFPLEGAWFVPVGPTPHTGHRWALPEEFAYDIARLGEGNSSHRGTGSVSRITTPTVRP